MTDYEKLRHRMVAQQIAGRGITDPRVLSAMEGVPRHLFVPQKERSAAYGDYPIAIGSEQTISQPFIVAFMTEELRLEPHHTVLEIGTGSGYQTAVLAEIVERVVSIELRPELAERASETLLRLGYSNVEVHCGDGFEPCAKEPGYPRIIVTAAPPITPQPLIDALANGGRMILPVGHSWAAQELLAVSKDSHGTVTEQPLLSVRFVPMIHQERLHPTHPPRDPQAG